MKTKLALTVVLLVLISGGAGQTALAQGNTPSWLRNAFMCIHKYEGAWNANTGNGYYGGLQMDWNFMRAYGSHYLRRYGPAHNWTPAMQIEVAARAYNSGRGFSPWPNTRRMCGL